MNELKGHGDPLLVAAMMKNLAIRGRQEVAKEKRPTCAEPHGDPLLAAVQKYKPTLKRAASLPTPLAMHSEFVGHGDPLMEKVLDSWKVVNVSDKENLHPIAHGESKKHGDPLFHDAELHSPFPLKRTESLPHLSPDNPVDVEGDPGLGNPLMSVLQDWWQFDEN